MFTNFSNSKMFPLNHKTIFVLDHTPYFGISCESPIEFEFLKSRTPAFIPQSPISKSLWTCSVEAAIEYCRIVWDLFPSGKLIRFFASDGVAHIMNTWCPTQQNLNHVMNGMSLIGIPPLPRSSHTQPEYTVVHGLRAAIEALGEPTDQQLDKKKVSAMGNATVAAGKLLNRSRIICITSARDNESIKRLQEIFNSCLHQHNKMVVNSDKQLVIDHCHLVIIHTHPVNIESQVSNQPPKNVSSLLTCEVHSVKAPSIPTKLSSLILDHYDLASTTVTGIPMKEEQNASSSANYDVEIFHARDAHTAIMKGNALDAAAAVHTLKDGLEYQTVTLKWCTPRGCTSSELQNCTSMYRITPTDVNSRPSLCLINFLLNGRSVMLEMPRKAGGKLTSHLLASHGGEIFIHTLCTARSVLEDPPSISEGCGGRVTDYRITDFGLFIQQNRLVPIKSAHASGADAANATITNMKTRLNRHTKYWPLTISSTFIFNLKNFIDPLPSIITKEKISEEEVVQCKQVIYHLVSLEAVHEPLQMPNLGQRVKGQKREEQYKIMWTELDTLLKNNCHSENHRAVYTCLTECHKFSPDEEKVELDQAIKELDQIGGATAGGGGGAAAAAGGGKKGKIDKEAQRVSVIRATTDSPMSPPPLSTLPSTAFPSFARSAQEKVGRSVVQPRTLYDIFTAQDGSKCRADFVGRVSDNVIAKLYPNLKSDNDRGPRGEGMEVE